jgi:hypothetical protein
MKRLYFLVPCLVLCACGRKQSDVIGPFQTTFNQSVDVAGKPDKRPGSWGLSEPVPIRMKINAPVGRRVRILRVDGDVVAWPKEGTMTGAQYAEVGWGLNTSLNDGSEYVSYPDDASAMAFDNSCAWVQDSLTATHTSSRVELSRDVSACGLLKDGIFISQSFVALNTSGLVIHIEPTMTITYQFE